MQKNQIDRIAESLGYVGRCLVILGMACGSILVWYIIINLIIR
jgi:uncharacterized membrane protein